MPQTPEPALATVAARIAAKTWGGRWIAESSSEKREPRGLPGSKGANRLSAAALADAQRILDAIAKRKLAERLAEQERLAAPRGRCVECSRPLTGNQRRYCGKLCQARARANG